MLAATSLSISLVGATATAGGASSSSYVAQINGARAARGLPALGVNGSLASVAQNWAAHMAASRALSHNPNLASQVPPGWRIIEENVGMGSNDGAIESSFAASPEHYDNMVNSGVTEVGVGEVSSGGYLWVVEDFWGGSSAPPPPVTVPPIRPGGYTPPAPSRQVFTGFGSGVRPYWGPVLQTPPTAAPARQPASSGPPADLNAVANQVQYFDTWD